MKVFCTRCGTPQEFSGPPGTAASCPSCGQQFVPAAQPAAAPAKKGMSGIVIALIVLAALAVPCTGILAAIAIPNFIRFQARSKQAECKSNLRALYTAERAYFSEAQAYSPLLAQVGFSPERGNRYAYFAGAEGTMEDRRSPSSVPGETDTAIGVDLAKFPSAAPVQASDLPLEQLGVEGECPECEITVACAGNVDSDPTLDVWSIASFERRGPNGEVIPAGELFQHVDDITE